VGGPHLDGVPGRCHLSPQPVTQAFAVGVAPRALEILEEALHAFNPGQQHRPFDVIDRHRESLHELWTIVIRQLTY
jgi:hypothetical protein